MLAGIGVPPNSDMRFSWLTFVTGKIPAMIGNVDPCLARLSTSDCHLSASKKNCVVAKVAPAPSLRTSVWISFSKSPFDAGWPSGKAATPMVNPPKSAASETNSSA